MKRKIGAILTLACLGTACFMAGCAEKSKIEQYQKQGYTIMVTYDANGGSFVNRQGVTIVDLFKPSEHIKEDGKVHVKLTEPTDVSRPTSGTGNISLTLQGHFFVGWYQTCELRTNEQGQVVDESGVALEEVDGAYYYIDTETEAAPAYIYSDRWDFENDTIDYEESDGLYEMTLYAAWVPYFQFDYYYRTGDSGEWTYLQSTAFDYKTTNAVNSPTHDKDTIWVPDWKDGEMNHQYRYANNAAFEFPKVDGTTFKTAYTDADCTQKIETTFEHQGTIDYEKGIAVNRVQNIYFEVEEGKRYKIETAEQFSKFGDLSSTFEIIHDLDFKNGDVKWPTALTMGTFEGEIFGENGQTYTFKNVSAKYSSTSAKNGGLFGKISANAVIKGIHFENATLDLAVAKTKSGEPSFGLFTGIIEENATISNVTIGGTLRLGEVSLGTPDYRISLLANGNLTGITAEPIKVQVYGKAYGKVYQYAFKPELECILIDQTDWTIKLDFGGKDADRRRDFESLDIGTYEIQQMEV